LPPPFRSSVSPLNSVYNLHPNTHFRVFLNVPSLQNSLPGPDEWPLHHFFFLAPFFFSPYLLRCSGPPPHPPPRPLFLVDNWGGSSLPGLFVRSRGDNFMFSWHPVSCRSKVCLSPGCFPSSVWLECSFTPVTGRLVKTLWFPFFCGPALTQGGPVLGPPPPPVNALFPAFSSSSTLSSLPPPFLCLFFFEFFAGHLGILA